MQKIDDVKTPTNLEKFRQSLKKYCKSYKHNTFIYNKINYKKTCVNIKNVRSLQTYTLKN